MRGGSISPATTRGVKPHAVTPADARSSTHRVDGEELREVGLRVSQEGAVPVGVVGEALAPLARFGAGQQDPDL